MFESALFFNLSTDSVCDSLLSMNKLFSHSAVFKSNLIAMIGILLCGYFSYHAISGERSLIRLISLNHVIEEHELDKDIVISERQILEAKVIAMRPGSVEKDLLEERAREVLGYRRSDEVVILQGLRN